MTDIDCRSISRLVPSGIQVSNAGRYVCPDAVLRLKVRRVLMDAVVDGVDRFNVFLVELEPESIDLRVLYWYLQRVRNDLLAKVSVTRIPQDLPTKLKYPDSLVDQTGRGKLGVKSMSKNFGKAPLVMVKALNFLVIHPADVDDDVASFQNSRVSRTLEA